MIQDYTSSVRAETYLITQHVLTKCPTDNRVCSEETCTRGQQGVQRGNMYPWTTGCAAKKQVPADNRCVQRGNKYPRTTGVCSEETSTRGQQVCAARKQVPADNRCVQRGNKYLRTTGVCSEETSTRGQQVCAARKQVPVDNKAPQREAGGAKRRQVSQEVLTNSSSSELVDMVSPASRSANSSPRCIKASRLHTGRQPSRGTQHTTPHGRLRAAQCPHFTHDSVLTSHTTVSSLHTRQCPRLTHDSAAQCKAQVGACHGS